MLYEGVEPLFRAFSAFKVVKAVDHSNDGMRGFSASSSNTDRSKIVRSILLLGINVSNETCAHYLNGRSGTKV